MNLFRPYNRLKHRNIINVLIGCPGLSGIFRLLCIIYYSLTSLFRSIQICAMFLSLWECQDYSTVWDQKNNTVGKKGLE